MSVSANRMATKNRLSTTVSLVSRLLYFTCMKNRMTSVAFTPAMARATIGLNEPRLTNAAPTVRADRTISAPKIDR